MQLLQHFKELTIRPKNAQELKGLVLQLAIQGKLTAKWRKENQNIEHASELLKRTLREKEQLINDKKLKKEKPLPQISEEEIPFRISQTWVWTRLGEIGTTNVGLTYKPAHKGNTGVPVLRSSNIQEGELCLKDLVRVNTDYRDKDIIEEGDLLICARNGSRRLVGKCTIIGQINEVMVFGAFMAIFRSKFNPYLQLFIQSPQYRSKLDGVETTTINQITQGNLKATTVPLPPLEEQKEIVKVVETLFKEVEQLEQLTVARIGLKEDFVTSALQQLTSNNAKQEWTFLQDHFKSFFNEITNIKKLRETVLQLAVQGKLTADWRENNPDTEDASQLLKHIQKEKTQLIKDKKIKKEKALPKITKDEIPYELPEGWVWCRVLDFCEKIFDGPFGSHLKTSDYTESGVQVVRLGNIGQGTFIYEKKAFISQDKYETIIGHTLIKDDILVASFIQDGVNSCLFPKLPCRAVAKADCFTVRLTENGMIPSYVLNSLYCKDSFRRLLPLVRGMTRLRINTSHLKKLLIPIPPIEEQKAIVEKVTTLMGLCDALEQEVHQSQEHSEQLMQSVLREVFEG